MASTYSRKFRTHACTFSESLPPKLAIGLLWLCSTRRLLDTLDTPWWLEQTDPVAYRGMGAAAIELVQAIRRFSPTMPIIVNRGYGILPGILRLIEYFISQGQAVG